MPPLCGVARALGSLSGRDHDVLVETLALPEGHPEYLTAQEVADCLAAEGLPGSDQMVTRHRRGSCSCKPAQAAA